MKGVSQIDERNIYGTIEKGKITRFIKKKDSRHHIRERVF